MSIATPGDDLRCDHCDRPGIGYRYRGRSFSGLSANRGERLCPGCLERAAAADGVDVLVINRAGTHAFTLNTATDADLAFPANPEGIDGRDLARRIRRRSRHH